MGLELKWPLMPMEAQSVAEIPVGPHWQYEPKWDVLLSATARK